MISIPARQTLALAGLLVLLPAASASAHDGHAGWNVWTWAPTGTTAITFAALLYGRGLWTLWRRAGVGRGIPVWRACSYAAGLMALVAALLSPIAYLSESLQSAHMVQHMILLLVATPLLVVGTPLFVMLWALPARWRQQVAQWWHGARRWQTTWEALSQPLIVWALYAVTLWVWHVPRFYEAALQNSYLHDLQHLGFLATSGLLWWLLLNPMGRLRLDRGAGVLYLFTTSLHATALGVFLTLSPTAWYDYYVQTAARWNLTALEDQQIAGAIMWMPACVVYLVVAAIIFSLWLRESEARDRRLERIEVSSDGRIDPMDTLLRDAAEGAA